MYDRERAGENDLLELALREGAEGVLDLRTENLVRPIRLHPVLRSFPPHLGEIDRRLYGSVRDSREGFERARPCLKLRLD